MKKVSVTHKPISNAGEKFWEQGVIGRKEYTIDDVMQKLDVIEKKLDRLLGIDPPEDNAQDADGGWVVNK